jgi:endonuclease-3 related protein
MASLTDSYDEIRAALAAHYGRFAPPTVPTGESFAAVVATFLGRSAEPRAVSGALTGLRDAGLLEPGPLAEVAPAEVAEVIGRSGLKAKARAVATLGKLAGWFVERGESIAVAATETLREELVAINGVGPATADAILLLALGRTSYPVDRATYRILVRHDWLDPSAGYDDARDRLERLDPDEPARLAELGAWLDRVGAAFCKAAGPRCERCPLRPFLPDGGPRAPEP